jgi:hypothetical protein
MGNGQWPMVNAQGCVVSGEKNGLNGWFGFSVKK